MDERTDVQTDGRTGRCTNGRADGLKHGRADGRFAPLITIHSMNMP